MVLEEKTMKFSRFAETIQLKNNNHVVSVTVTLKISDCNGIIYFTDLQLQDGDQLTGYTVHTSKMLTKKSQPDIPANQWFAYEQFVSKALKYGFRSLFTSKQLSRAFRQAGVQNKNITPTEILYVQWLCLFRCYWEHVLGRK
jgi:hypothetical protein